MRVLSALLGSSLLTIATVAQAQSEKSVAATQDAGQVRDQNALSPDESDVGAIIVTANRREERLQRVPVAVTLVGGEQLTQQNINTVEGLTRAAPALTNAGPPGLGALSIRGVGGLSFSRSSEGSVGVVVDGVALANTSTNPPLLFDVARVEVLEGPQGTLFGRNSSAGVINITTNAPEPSKIEAFAYADIGTRNNYIARAVLNLPIASNAALRVTGSYSQDPQVQRNLFDGSFSRREGKAARARMLWEPSDAVTVNLSADYTDTDVNGGSSWAVYSSNPTSLLTARLNACGVTVGPDNQDGCVNPGIVSSATTYGFSGQIDVDLGGPTLTSITALRRVRSGTDQDADSTTANRLFQSVSDRINNFSQELRVSSPNSGVVEFVAGVYYFKSELDAVTVQSGQVLADLPLIGACPLPAPSLCGLTLGQSRPVSTSTESYAAFAQATINASDRLRFILGGRLGREDVRASSPGSTTVEGALAPFAASTAIRARAADTYFSYRLGAQYDVTPDVMAFATYTRGYKGPATNDTATSAAIPLLIKPEIPKSGEVGFKATLAGGRAALNATAFYTKVSNFQAQFFDPSIPAFIFGNAPELTSKGVSAQLFGRPARGLTTNLGVMYLDAEYGPGYAITDFRNAITSAEGRQLVGSAKWTITASAEYSTTLSGEFDAFVQADAVYRSKSFSNATNDPILATDGAAIFGGRIGIRTDDERFGVAVFARNIFDTFRPSTRFATPLAAQQLDPLSFSQFVGPEGNRVVGLSLDARF